MLNFQNRGVSMLNIFKQHVSTHTGFQLFLCRQVCRYLCQVLVFHWLSVPYLYILESHLQAKVTQEDW